MHDLRSTPGRSEPRTRSMLPAVLSGDAPGGRTSGRVLLVLFTAATFCSAFLLFTVQPLFARLILPLLGGAPAVWTACMLFFQAALLAGYWYAHASIRALGVPRQTLLHAVVVLLPLAVLPFDVQPAMVAGREAAPVAWLMGLMLTGIGLPFVVLATTAPLLQRWFAATDHPSAADPYFLYAASNAGSLAALLMYPVVVEPLLSLRAQRMAWAWGYVAAAALVVACGWAASRLRAEDDGGAVAAAEETIPWALRLRWLALALVPSGLLLAVTAHVSTDLAAIPLLWIVPLALYLATFIVAFGSRREAASRVSARLLPQVLLLLVVFLITQGAGPIWLMLPLHLVTFTTFALLCHSELARLRPSAAGLTSFYLWMAGGGALGGLLNTAAPWVFAGIAEYPLLIAGACFVLIRPVDFRALREPRTLVKPVVVGVLTAGALLAARPFELGLAHMFALLGLPAVLTLSTSRRPAAFALCMTALLGAGWGAGLDAWGHVLHQQRTFFGVYRVTSDTRGHIVSLYHGTTRHGGQAAGAGAPEPLTYFHRGSPVADVLALRPAESSASIGVVGLGVGSLAAYARPGEAWIFYEIDPAVDDIARDTRFFTFLEACGASCTTVIGDGRLALAASRTRYDVIVLDAFSSDAIPVHLLTREAIQTYMSRLSEDGMLAFHVSNRHFDLQPVLGGVAADLQLVAFMREDVADGVEGHSSSRWVALGRSNSRVQALAGEAGWRPVTSRTARVWTDDFSNIWSVLWR
jgi:hypothetical protein